MALTLSAPDSLNQDVQVFLKDDLASVNELLAAQFRSTSPFVREIGAHVARFQGKQIRPVVTLLAARSCQSAGDCPRSAHVLAATVELIHTATLVHDDVLDDATLRRHVATVHRRWNTETSVLYGDFLLSRAFHLAATTGDAEACRLIGRATDKTCEGELNQMAARLEQSTRASDYFRIIGGKTAQLFAVAAQLGARAAGAGEAAQRRLRVFGRRLGLAFQIADDVLDLQATSQQTGKDAANDLSNRRLTLPLIRALHHADERDRASVLARLAILASLQEADSGLRRLLELGLADATRIAAELAHRAATSLNLLPQSAATDLLRRVAGAVIR